MLSTTHLAQMSISLDPINISALNMQRMCTVAIRRRSRDKKLEREVNLRVVISRMSGTIMTHILTKVGWAQAPNCRHGRTCQIHFTWTSNTTVIVELLPCQDKILFLSPTFVTWLWSLYFCRLKAYVLTFLDSFLNKSRKPPPIWTKVLTHAQVKGGHR